MNKNYFNDTKVKESLKDNQLREATNNLESIFVKKMLEIAYKNSNIAGKGPGHEIIKSMYIDELSKVGSGSIGISQMIYDSLKDKR
jgi:Rod binding domain-containing protein